MVVFIAMFVLTCFHYDKRIKELEEINRVMLTSIVNLIEHQSKQDDKISELQRGGGITMKCNICWNCGNACANKCKYIRFGTAIDGWTAKKGKGNYSIISQCPNFVTDGDIGLNKIGELLGLHSTTVYQYATNGRISKLQARAKEKGYAYRFYKSDETSVHILLPLGVQRGLDSNERL